MGHIRIYIGQLNLKNQQLFITQISNWLIYENACNNSQLKNMQQSKQCDENEKKVIFVQIAFQQYIVVNQTAQDNRALKYSLSGFVTCN